MPEERKIIYVCCACGKMSNDRYGYQKISQGWDESCMMNSVKVYEDKCIIVDRRVVSVQDGGVIEGQ